MPTEYLIWWLCDEDIEVIGEKLPHNFPKYLQEQFQSRCGRAGRGRLWAAKGMREAVRWRKTAMARRLMDYGGIVIDAKNLNLLATLPGIVTDFTLQRPEIGVVLEHCASHQS